MPVAEHEQAIFREGIAHAPQVAPLKVTQIIEAGNALQKKPYKWGGGHGDQPDEGYDCSGTVSYVLRLAGLLDSPLDSRSFVTYGEAGEGKWITIYARPGHVFMTVAGLRLDTTGRGGTEEAPRWRVEPRSPAGFVARHPSGL